MAALIDPAPRRSRRQRHDDDRDTEAIVWAWREACHGAGLYRAIDTASGTTISTPRVTAVRLGPSPELVVELQPGQLAVDVRTAAYRIAPSLGGVVLRVEPRGLRHVRVTVLDRDPLDDPLPLVPGPGVLIGRDEGGDELRLEPVALPHLIVQGQTRSGKSTFLYALLAQLVRDPHVQVAGVDPSGITLRPFAATAHAARQVCGLADLDRIERTVAALVADMDARLAAMPLDRDILPTGPDWPLIVIVLDEYPALLRALDAADPKTGKRVRALVARLLAESHKVGHRVVIAAQRAEATIVGAAERAQCAGRLSFRVDSADSVKLLHADGDHYAADHTAAAPGIALCSWPGRPLSRIRGPHIGGYAEFVAAVSGPTAA